VILAILLLAVASSLHAAPPPRLYDGLEPGPRRVGYLHLEKVDLWYPATVATEPMTLRRYMGERAEEPLAFLRERGISAAAIDAVVDEPLLASREAPPDRERRWPLLLIAQGNGQDAVDQSILAEYLASFGFVVASVPSPMLRRPMTGESEIGEFAELQADDLERAWTAAEKLLPVDGSRAGVIGHSFGARSALFLAMRRRPIRALVSLDGGIGTATGIDEMRSAKSFAAGRRLPPLLHFYERLDSFMHPDFMFLRALRFEKQTLADAGAMHHFHFTWLGYAAATNAEFAKVTHAPDGLATAVKSMDEKVRDFVIREVKR